MSKKMKQAQPRPSAKNPTFATLLVGPDKERFVVHENLLVAHSDFFRAALQGGFKEAEEKTVRLETEKVDIVEFFVHWLYYQRFPSTDEGDDSDLTKRWNSNHNNNINKVKNLVKLYIFGDTYQSSRLREHTMNEFFKSTSLDCEGLADNYTLNIAFDKLDAESPMCRYIVDADCLYGGPNLYDLCSEDSLPRKYMFAALRRLAYMYLEDDNGKRNSVEELELCDYHEHKNDEEKVQCKIQRAKRSR